MISQLHMPEELYNDILRRDETRSNPNLARVLFTAGVLPSIAQVMPACWSDRTPASSPKNIYAFC